MFHRASLFALLLWTPAAWAQMATAPMQLRFAAYAAGMQVLDLQTNLIIAPQTYRIQLSYQVVGMAGALFNADSISTVDGHFRGDVALPRELFTTGRSRGERRVTQIDWRDGSPVVTQMVPPLEEEREPVPLADQAHAIDPLSGMAALLHKVQATGRCDGAMTTYDGRRLSLLEARTVGEEELAETSRSSFHGPALRCDVEGRMLAGFERDRDPEAMRRPQHGSVWFAHLAPGGPALPVRITFQNRYIGEATLYLAQAG